MRKTVVTLCAVVALSAGACTTTHRPAAGGSPVESFVSAVVSQVDVDYNPLTSPAAAVGAADLIVEGVLVEVIDGITLTYPDPLYTERRSGRYATFVIAVDRVIAGGPAPVGGKVYVSVHKNRSVGVDQLNAANPRPRVVAVLDDLAGWKPGPEVTVSRPAGVPAAASLYAPYSDGLWLQGTAEQRMRGLYADPADLAPAWGKPVTVDQVAAALRQAAQGR